MALTKVIELGFELFDNWIRNVFMWQNLACITMHKRPLHHRNANYV